MTILWAINDRNGAALPLVNKEVHLYYTCERGRFEADIEIQDENVVIWHFLGKDQRVLGSYTLTLEILQSEGKRTIKKDVCNAFVLVGKDCEEDYDDDEAHISNGGEITLASDLDIYRISPIIPYIGEDGYWYIDGVKTEWYAYGSGEPGRNIVVNSMEELEALNVRKGSLASVVSKVNEVQKPLSELYDYIAEGGDPMGNDVPYSALDTITDIAFTFPNLSSWPAGNLVLGSKSGGPNAVCNIQVDAKYVRLFYVVEGKANVIILAEKNGASHIVNDDAVAEAHAYLRAIPDLCYYGVHNGSVSDMEQFFKAIVAEETADAYILGETWQRLMKDGEMPEIDLTALATKEEVIENEEVTAAALNDLNDKKASKEDVANAIAEAITNALNTAV